MPSLKPLARDSKIKKKSAAPKKSTKPAPPQVSFKSTEYVQKSDEEEQQSSENKNESDSDEDSLPSTPTDVVITPNGKLQGPARSSSSSENESESEESGSEAGDEEEEEPSFTVKKTAPAIESIKPAIEPATEVITSQRQLPYKPPIGFEKASLESTLNASQMFKRPNLEGKQIWYFTAPASVAISSIEPMSLGHVTGGKAILNHNGSEYCFRQDLAEDKTYTKIMVPQSFDGYRTTSKAIDQIFHLQQVVKLAGGKDIITTTASSSKATIPTKKPVRQQPQGLKMRFRPIGFGDGETGRIGSSSSSVDGSSIGSVSDEEMEEAPATFRRPASIASDSSEAEESSENAQSSDDSSSSDAEISGAPPLSSKPAAKNKGDKTSDRIKSFQQITNASMKRKHGQEEEKKSKHRSSRPSSIDNRELKRLKEKRTDSQRSVGDRATVSIEPHKSPSERFSTKLETTPSKKDGPIHVPSQAKSMQIDQQASEKQKFKKRDRSESATPVPKNGISLRDLTRTTDPSLIAEKRAKKMQKLKHEK